MSIVPCVTWVRRGKAKSKPEKLTIDKDDLQRIIEETEERLEDEDLASDDEDTENSKPKKSKKLTDAEADIAKARAFAKQLTGSKKEGASGGGDDFESRYNMDDYDNEENDWSNPLKGIGGLSVYASNDDDPYVTLKNEEDSDEEDFEIKPTDNLMLAARVESEFCSMEVHVYNSELDNFYVHHDVLLSTFPLTLEWMDYDLRDGSTGNFVAVATMDPTIDIWDLDLVDSLEPLATLGEKLSKKKKKKKGRIGHNDAVLDLSWNHNAKHILASASADHTVGLWDLTDGRMAMCLKQHKDKVQCVKWHPAEEHVLLSGSFDKSVIMYDCRTPETGVKTWNMDGEIEKLLWNQFSPVNFFASTDKGNVLYMDSRQDKPIYTLSAHTESVTGLCMSCEDSRMLITSSTDHMVKVWDISDNKPSLIDSQDAKMGQLHSMSSCPDAAYVVAIGGEKNVKVWDLRDCKNVVKHFCPSQMVAGDVKEEVEETVDIKVEEIEDSGVAMETLETEVTMETETAAPTTENVVKKKKKKKKKSKNAS